jgi:hypothetical protein
MSNIIFNEQNTGIDKLNIVVPKQMGNNNSPATISGVVDKEPVWGTFQGNYRRTGSKAFDCPSSTISYTGSLILCEGNAIVLTASEGISYLWSTGETSKTITVNKAGDYSVTVTTLNGCSSSSTNVSIKTAVWIVICKHPAILAPAKGLDVPNSSRSAIKPGISASAKTISLRPQAARLMSLTL